MLPSLRQCHHRLMAREHLFFVSAGHGGLIPTSSADLLFDNNVVSFGEWIASAGYLEDKVQHRRFADLVDWMRTCPDVGMMLYAGASEGSYFDGYSLSPYKLARRLHGVEQLINTALDHPELNVFSKDSPFEVFVDDADIEQACNSIRDVFGRYVLPNYAALAKWRLMTGNQPRNKRTHAQSTALLIELHDWLTQTIHYVPVAWTLLSIAEFAKNTTSQQIYDRIFKVNGKDTARSLNSGAWDSGFLGMLAAAQSLAKPGRTTVFVTDDDALAATGKLLIRLADDTYAFPLDTLEPANEDAWVTLMQYRSQAYEQRSHNPPPLKTYTELMPLIGQLQHELNIPEEARYQDAQPYMDLPALTAAELGPILDKLLADGPVGQQFPDPISEKEAIAILDISRVLANTLSPNNDYPTLLRQALPTIGGELNEVLEHPLGPDTLVLMAHWGTNSTTMQMSLESFLGSPRAVDIAIIAAGLTRAMLIEFANRTNWPLDKIHTVLVEHLTRTPANGPESEHAQPTH